jgi:hypothetical protein
MAFVPTMIGKAVGDKSMGKPAPNSADDVRKVQHLLRTVLGPAAPRFQDGICDQPLKTAISAFQRAWGAGGDGTIDPHGQTLKRLNRLAHPLLLQPIKLARVLQRLDKGKILNDGGGYAIAYRTCDNGPLPPPGRDYSVFLSVMDTSHGLDVTGRPAHDLLSDGNLGDLLSVFDRLGVWGGLTVPCRVLVKFRGVTITSSNVQTLQTPVMPHNGIMLPLDDANNGPALTYQGDPDAKDFHGRMFAEVPGFSKKMFIYAGLLETQNEFRGFDCITYVGTACGASNLRMSASADLADSVQAARVSIAHKGKDKSGKDTVTRIELESADPTYVKEFFSANTSGYFLMWSGGHIVIVADGTVHEFKHSEPSGYNQTPVLTWLEPYKTMKLTVRRLPDKPKRAF